MRHPVDFGKRTFLEWVSLAARERVYSAAFAWALDEKSPLPLEQRLSIVAALSGAETASTRAIKASTEHERIDLLLTVEREIGPLSIAIENKIKATEGQGQLAIYDQHLDKLPGTVKKVFLTLTGEAPRSGADWLPVTYTVLLDALRAQPASIDPYVADLCDALARLVAACDVTREDAEDAAVAAFKDQDIANVTAVATYIDEMRLNKVVQRRWMMALAARLGVKSPWQVSFDETRGQALLNVGAALRDRPGYQVGVQLQWRTLKAFCAPYPYLSDADEDKHRTVETILETIRSGLALSRNARPSNSQKRGFRSFSIAKLPPGRNLDEWTVGLKPQFARLFTAFPAAVPLAAGTAPPLDERE